MRISRAVKHYYSLRETIKNKTKAHIVGNRNYTRLVVSKQEIKTNTDENVDSPFGFSLYLMGEFTSPPWSEKILMDQEKEEFAISIKLRNHQKIKFMLLNHATNA